ncbi:hypothetical protein J2X71_001599 [Rhizobium sp. 1399]|jgi:hypothetical protein|nr:hypothetical protein [Rhizobium sp. 1399]
MRNEPVDIGRDNSCLLQRPLRGFGHQGDGAREDLAAVLHRRQEIFGTDFGRERLVAAAGRDVDQAIAAAIRYEIGGEEAASPVRSWQIAELSTS